MPSRLVGHEKQSRGLVERRSSVLDWNLCPQVFGENMQVKLYAPPQSKMDPSIAVMLLIAIVTVALGGWWSRACER